MARKTNTTISAVDPGIPPDPGYNTTFSLAAEAPDPPSKPGGLLGFIFSPLIKVFEYTVSLILSLVWKPIELFLDFLGDKIMAAVTTHSWAGEEILVQWTGDINIWSELRNAFGQARGIGKIIAVPIVIAAYAKAIVQIIFGYFQNHVTRMVNRENQDTILPLEPVYRARWVGRVSDTTTREIEMDNGIKYPAGEILEEAMRPNLDVTMLYEAYWRNLITWDELGERLGGHGYRYPDIQMLMRLSERIPPLNDIIRMAVREAFSPEIANRFGQYEDYPPEVEVWAKQQGLSGDWSRRYWAAHWDLPSITMGFDMLHRGIIGQEELTLLLRALDVMPYWRDRLIQLSYLPYTRVDVRRMYSSGILDREGVKKSYLDRGYDDEHAENLTRWTVQQSLSKEMDLTKAELLEGYRLGMLQADPVLQALLSMGYDQAEAEYYLAREDYKREAELKKDQVEIVHQQFLFATLDLAGARAALAGLNLAADELDMLLTKWQAELAKKTYQPPLGDLKAWLAGGLMSEAEFRDELKRRGVRADYIDKYVEQVIRKASA